MLEEDLCRAYKWRYIWRDHIKFHETRIFANTSYINYFHTFTVIRVSWWLLLVISVIDDKYKFSFWYIKIYAYYVYSFVYLCRSLLEQQIKLRKKTNHCLKFSLVFPIIWILINKSVVIIKFGYAKNVRFGREIFILSPVAYITVDFKELVGWLRFGSEQVSREKRGYKNSPRT